MIRPGPFFLQLKLYNLCTTPSPHPLIHRESTHSYRKKKQQKILYNTVIKNPLLPTAHTHTHRVTHKVTHTHRVEYCPISGSLYCPLVLACLTWHKARHTLDCFTCWTTPCLLSQHMINPTPIQQQFITLLNVTAHSMSCFILLLLPSPATSLGFTIFGEIFAYVTIFNPTIEVVTFCLHGCCTL